MVGRLFQDVFVVLVLAADYLTLLYAAGLLRPVDQKLATFLVVPTMGKHLGLYYN